MHFLPCISKWNGLSN